MNETAFLWVAGVFFSIAALLHALRLVGRWRVQVKNWTVPHGLSWVGLTIAGYLAYSAFSLLLRS